MIMGVHSGQEAGPGRTANGRRCVGMIKSCTFETDLLYGFNHRMHPVQLHILVVGEDEHDIGEIFGNPTMEQDHQTKWDYEEL